MEGLDIAVSMRLHCLLVMLKTRGDWGDYIPNWLSISATSSLPTVPSLSLSNIWKPSRRVLTCDGCSCERAFSFAMAPGAFDGCERRAAGDGASSAGAAPRGVQLAAVGVELEELLANLEVLLCPCVCLTGDVEGVVWVA